MELWRLESDQRRPWFSLLRSSGVAASALALAGLALASIFIYLGRGGGDQCMRTWTRRNTDVAPQVQLVLLHTKSTGRAMI